MSNELARRSAGEATGREFLLLVTALMAITAVGIDLMLPAFPDMRAEFGMSPDSTRVALTVTAYFLGMAVGPWLFGPISDRTGRRKPLVAGLVLYAAASMTAALAPSWPLLVAARFVWGIGASGPNSLAIAMVRDRYEGDEMAQRMSMIMSVFLMVPIVAPSLGAGLIAIFPWRAVFWFPALVAVTLLVWSRRLPETHSHENRRPFTWSSVTRAGREVVTHRQVMSLTLAITFLRGIINAYISGSEIILSDVYHYGSWFPLFFGAIGVLLSLNSLNNSRLVGKVGVVVMIRRVTIIALVFAGAMAAVSFMNVGKPNFWLIAVLMGVTMPLTNGLSPACNTVAMSPVPHVAGTAAAIIATVATAGGAALGLVATRSFDGTVRPFAVYVLVYVVGAALFIALGLPRPRGGSGGEKDRISVFFAARTSTDG